jgi:hypothetical protein
LSKLKAVGLVLRSIIFFYSAGTYLRPVVNLFETC